MTIANARCGLTLLELVVVLVILAALSGVAVQSLEPIADQTRYEATQKTQTATQSAIIEDRLQVSGARQVTGFVTDLGRLPESLDMLFDANGTTTFAGGALLSSFPFQEWAGPDASSPPVNPTAIDCRNISLRCGWRGPYLNVENRANGVVDGWGRPFAFVEFPSVGDDVHLIWTAVTPQYTDKRTNVESLALQTVSGTVQNELGAAIAGTVEVALVYPDITVSTSTLVVMEDADGSDTDSSFRFENVPVGVRVLVFDDGSGGVPEATRYIEVSPMQQPLIVTATEF